MKKSDVLAELWENAMFDEQSYSSLEKLAGNLEKNKINSKKNLPPEDISFALTTARNKNLITTDEQKMLSQTVVAFFGLSVGSHSALTWMMISRAANIKIVDPDSVSPSNLNRLRFGWSKVNKLKTKVVKEQLLDINPYCKVFTSVGTKSENLEKICLDNPKINVIVDAIDDINGKIILRKIAKKLRLPLLSAADVGDNVIFDIERHDNDPETKFFHGRIPEDVDFTKLPLLERKKMIIKLVGFEKNSEKMLDSVLNIGKKTLTWPQLGSTATIAGGIVASAIKKIVLGENIKSGRYYFSLDDILVSDFNHHLRIKERNKKIKQIKERLHL